MAFKSRSQTVWLDYGQAGRIPNLLTNLSCVAPAGEHLWTASDETRSIECLAPDASGYRLRQRYLLDELFAELPGADDGHEADIEALDVVDGRLWVCGSHSLTRRSQTKTKTGQVDWQIHKRPSRRLLCCLPLTKDGGGIAGAGKALPFEGSKNLRELLGRNAYLAPFMDLPSKENGFDIEGIAMFKRVLYVGLRGPVIDNIAIIAALSIGTNFTLNEKSLTLHFVDLGGLGVRDLTRWGSGMLILAGPVSNTDRPFHLFEWRPRQSAKIQQPKKLLSMPAEADHPEGICALRRGGKDGLLVLYDTQNPKRRRANKYPADLITLPGRR